MCLVYKLEDKSIPCLSFPFPTAVIPAIPCNSDDDKSWCQKELVSIHLNIANIFLISQVLQTDVFGKGDGLIPSYREGRIGFQSLAVSPLTLPRRNKKSKIIA